MKHLIIVGLSLVASIFHTGGVPDAGRESPGAETVKPRLIADVLPPQAGRAEAAGEPFDHTHSSFAELLRGVVIGDKVKYEEVRARLPALKAYNTRLAQVSRERLAKFSRDQALAFWINAYNAHILETVAEAGPIKSIRDIPDVFSTRRFSVAGRSLTFDTLENEIIRPEFKEPRIHFALNCAARSCPRLQTEPFRADRLEAQLEAAAAAFVRDSRHNQIDTAQKTVRLSKIFEWFGGDFVARYPAPQPKPGISPAQAATLAFVGRYLGEKERALLTSGAPKVEYLEYDWALNSAR